MNLTAYARHTRSKASRTLDLMGHNTRSKIFSRSCRYVAVWPDIAACKRHRCDHLWLQHAAKTREFWIYAALGVRSQVDYGRTAVPAGENKYTTKKNASARVETWACRGRAPARR